MLEAVFILPKIGGVMLIKGDITLPFTEVFELQNEECITHYIILCYVILYYIILYYIILYYIIFYYIILYHILLYYIIYCNCSL
jgi:hypothetical protein